MEVCLLSVIQQHKMTQVDNSVVVNHPKSVSYNHKDLFLLSLDVRHGLTGLCSTPSPLGGPTSGGPLEKGKMETPNARMLSCGNDPYHLSSPMARQCHMATPTFKAGGSS